MSAARTFLMLLLPAALCSCAKEIVMDAGDEPLVVVECVLTQQPVQTLRLSFTKSVSMSNAPELPEAEAVLIDLTEGKTAGSFERQDDGTWTLGYAAVPEHSYRLEVDVPGHETVWAEQTIPDKPAIESYFSLWSPSKYWEPFTQRHLGSVFIVDRHNIDADYIWLWALNYNPDSGRREYVERLCTDWPYVDNFNLTGDLYVPPVADTSILGDKVTSELYPRLEGKSMHDRFLRLDIRNPRYMYTGNITGEYSPTYVFMISGDFEGKYFHRGFEPKDWDKYTLQDDDGVVVAAIATKDYDAYLRDAIYFKRLSESSDLSSIYNRENIFSNIHGGLGIFGAYTTTYLGWFYGYNSTEWEYLEKPFD